MPRIFDLIVMGIWVLFTETIPGFFTEEKRMQAYQQRVVDERKELDELSLTLQNAHAKVKERCLLLNKFIIESPLFDAMPEQQQQLLRDQRSCMRSVSGQLSALLYSAEGIERYREILGSRIEAFN